MSATAAERGHQSQAHEDPAVSQHRLRFLQWGVVALDLGVLALGVALNQAHWSGDRLALAIWGLLIAAAASLSVPTGGARLGLDLPLVLGAGLVFGPIAAGLLALIAVFDVREFRREVSFSLSMFNRAEISLSAMAGTVAYLAVRQQLGDWPGAALAGVLAVAVDALVNYVLVASYWTIKSGKPFKRVVAGMRFGPAHSFIPIYACFGFVGVLIAEVYTDLGMVGVVMCVAPVVLAWQAFAHRRLLDESLRSLEVKERLFRQFGEQIAIERRDERSILAGELHDAALPPIFQVHLMGQVIKQEFSTGRLEELEGDVPLLLEAADEANSIVRGLVGGLRRSQFGMHGLSASLEAQAQRLESLGYSRFKLSVEEIDASATAKNLVYSVCREAMWNASKHSSAELIRVCVNQTDGGIRVAVIDNGAGFDLSMAARDGHFGLEMLTERVEAAGGEMVVESTPGMGSTIAALIPADA